MKNIILILFVFSTLKVHCQYIDFEKNPNYTLTHYGSRNNFYLSFSDIKTLQKTRFVLYFRNSRSYLYQIDTVLAKDVDEKIYGSIHCQFPKTPIDGYGRDSIVFNIEPLTLANYYDLKYTIKRKSLDKTKNSDDEIDLNLKFSVVSPIMENAQIGFPYLTKHYDIGQVYKTYPKPSIPLKYYQKGKDPLLAELFYKKEHATRAALRGELLKPGESRHFYYDYPVDKMGRFEDTLYVFTNGLDSLHQITVSGELLEVAGDQPIFADFLDNNTIYCDTIRLDSLHGINRDTYEKDIKIKNIGKAPLIIQCIRSSNIICDYPKEPIKPNETSIITMRLYASNRTGPFSKSITIETNEPYGIKVLLVKGYFDTEKKE
jgi:Protein of unknown function (DUF1573)